MISTIWSTAFRSGSDLAIRALTLTVLSTGLGVLSFSQNAQAQDGAAELEEIVVTARRREENLQDIPDAVTVFSGATIEAAGIVSINDVANMTPNLMIREGFRDGVSFITMRGVTTAQQGLPPVTVVVDGVQVASLDFVNQGLVDISSIEVLRGPQGALYGAGAMAGAINISTNAPTNEFEGKVKAALGSGNDKRVQGILSDSLFDSDTTSYRVRAMWRDFDGVTDNVSGNEVDFDESLQLSGRLLHSGEDVSVDFRVGYGDYESGAVEQARIAARPLDPVNDPASLQAHAMADFTGALFVPVLGINQTINDFEGAGFQIESDFRGIETREFVNVSLKLDYEFNSATLTSITAFDEATQELKGDSDWAGTDILGIGGAAASGLFPDLVGLTNVTGRAQNLVDDFEAWSQEIRLTSSSDQQFRWLVGGWYQDRKAQTVLSLPVALNTNQLGPDFFAAVGAPFPRTDDKNDELWAIFGQVNYDISDALELTVALRYDDATYDDTGYQCFDCNDPSVLLPTNDAQGNAQNTLTENDSELQPKVSLSYDWNDEWMTYLSYAEGFRPGFFSTGNPTAAETTTNYEVGFKYTSDNRRLSVFGSAFQIDYSEQQFSTIIGGPPFRITTNIPSVDIGGIELEVVARPTNALSISAGYGYINAEEANGLKSPNVPEYTFNIAGSYAVALGQNTDGVFRIDYRRQGKWYLSRMEIYEVSERDYLNTRFSINRDSWTFTAFGNNVLDEYQPNEFALIDGTVGFVKSWSGGRQYGVEASYSF